MLQAGDRYIHFTRYGSVNLGRVREITTASHVLDSENQVIYQKPMLVSESGVSYQLDGSDGKFYKIVDELSEEFLDKLNQVSHHARTTKNLPS